ncbi:MAG: Lon protease family protein, partial [Solirubrobacterales bacterium]
GRMGHLAQFGALVTDFNLIRAGALHRANGGYLVLDALEVLRQPYAWEGLKRALRARQLKLESLGETLGLMHTVSLEPEPVPLSVKVVLIGEPWIYYLLCARDPDFPDLFKVTVDFDERMARDAESEQEYARVVAGIAREEELKPFDRSAVARIVERAARLTADSERLSLNLGKLADLIREADHWAQMEGRDVVGAEDVQRAVEQQIYRSDRMRERTQQELLRGTLQVGTEGAAIGQVNGLSVLQLADFAFGRPSRITARIRLGAGEVVDIEREVKLAGPLHSKGVLILTGFLGERYATSTPLSLSASLVFEQSYGGVEGDSASLAELCALLSAVAGVPLKQSLAVTGSINQHGRVQAIGGVNEKIESFFDLCDARGLSGEQGVVIPRSNVVHLMLRQDVVEAVRDGRFHVYPVESVDEGIEILTGMGAGEAAEDGRYPEESFNGRVQKRLAVLATRRKEFGSMRVESSDQ